MRDDWREDQRAQSMDGEQGGRDVLRAGWVKSKAKLDHVLQNWNDEAVENFLWLEVLGRHSLAA